jgi:hypothetical protein
MTNPTPHDSPRYVLCPGWITSKNDGQRHFIDAGQLAHLYGVRLNNCLIRHGSTLRGANSQNKVFLYPRFDGDYILPPLPDV